MPFLLRTASGTVSSVDGWPATTIMTGFSFFGRPRMSRRKPIDLQGHPTAERCYAWEMDGGEVTVVLHEGVVNSPATAVLAAIMADAPEPAEAE